MRRDVGQALGADLTQLLHALQALTRGKYGELPGHQLAVIPQLTRSIGHQVVLELGANVKNRRTRTKQQDAQVGQQQLDRQGNARHHDLFMDSEKHDAVRRAALG